MTEGLTEFIRNELASPGFVPPLLPEVSMNVLRCMTKSDLDFHKVAEIILQDPLLAARVLRVASSPLYGNQEITSVVSGLARLGTKTVRGIALEYGMSALHVEAGGGYPEAMRGVVAHCVTTARFTRIVSNAADIRDDSLYTLGLLHDIGIIAGIAALSQHRERPPLDRDAWQSLSSLNTQACHLMFEAWECPQAMVEDLNDYHSMDCAKPSVCVVRLASELANQTWAPVYGVFGVDEISQTLFLASLEGLGLGESDWTKIRDNVLSKAP